MNSLLAKDQPQPQYEPPTDADKAYAQRLISLNFSAGNYTVTEGAGLSRKDIESGEIAPEIEGDSRDNRKARQVWIDALIERIRIKAQEEKSLFLVGQGYSSLMRKDYRR